MMCFGVKPESSCTCCACAFSCCVVDDDDDELDSSSHDFLFACAYCALARALLDMAGCVAVASVHERHKRASRAALWRALVRIQPRSDVFAASCMKPVATVRW